MLYFSDFCVRYAFLSKVFIVVSIVGIFLLSFLYLIGTLENKEKCFNYKKWIVILFVLLIFSIISYLLTPSSHYFKLLLR